MSDKGQVAETMTWIIATVVIIVILFATLSITGLNETAKKELKLDKKIDFNTEEDLIITKSFLSYLLTNEENGRVFDELKDKEGYPLKKEYFNDFEEKLAKKIFYIYEEYTPDFFWIGIVSNELIYNKEEKHGTGVGLVSNEEFGSRINPFVKLFYDNIKLNDKSVLEIILIKATK
jgi:hypothetical protein